MERDYLMLIIDGWVTSVADKLPNYFYREFKKADKEDIPPDEFILHLQKVVDHIKAEMKEPYIRDLMHWNDYYCQEAKKGIEIDTPMPKEYYHSLPLIWMTKQKYNHHISKHDIDYIEQCINEAFERLQKENNPLMNNHSINIQMYSIDSQKLKIKDLKTGGITTYNFANEKYKPKNQFDLRNENVYDIDGNLIEEAINPKDYDFDFANRLKEIHPVYTCVDFLNYHFEKTENKELFLKHIEYHILLFPFLKDKQTVKVEFIKNWVKEKNDTVLGNMLPKNNEYDLDYFKNIAKQLYLKNYKIGAVNYFTYENFIEAKQKNFEINGELYYQNIIHAMPVFGERIADEAKGETPTYKEKIFREVLNYCKDKIEKLNKPKRDEKIKKKLNAFFIDGAYIECMNALRNVKDPVISDDNRYLLGPRQKGAFTAFFKVLKLREKFIEVPTAAKFSQLLNNEILNLDLCEDGTTLNRNTTTMYRKYYTPLSKLIV